MPTTREALEAHGHLFRRGDGARQLKGDPLVRELDAQSLGWRDKPPKRP
jgi:hypothetical protein